MPHIFFVTFRSNELSVEDLYSYGLSSYGLGTFRSNVLSVKDFQRRNMAYLQMCGADTS